MADERTLLGTLSETLMRPRIAEGTPVPRQVPGTLFIPPEAVPVTGVFNMSVDVLRAALPVMEQRIETLVADRGRINDEVRLLRTQVAMAKRMVRIADTDSANGEVAGDD